MFCYLESISFITALLSVAIANRHQLLIAKKNRKTIRHIAVVKELLKKFTARLKKIDCYDRL